MGVARSVEKNRENDRPRQFYEYGAFQSRKVHLAVWGGNNSSIAKEAVLSVTAVDLANPSWCERLDDITVLLPPNASTDLHKNLPIMEPPKAIASDSVAPSGTVVVQVKLTSSDGEVLASRCDWPQPYRFLDFPDPQLDIQREGDLLVLTAGRPLKGLVLSLADWEQGDAEVDFEDNCVRSA